jgi:hypothetical protein
LSHHIEHFKNNNNIYNNAISPIVKYTPYRIANCIMVKCTTNENGTLMFRCKKCDKNKHNAYKTSYIVSQSPNYMNLMLFKKWCYW